MQRLTAMTEVQNDQQHIPAVLWSDPRVPDRTEARLARRRRPLALVAQRHTASGADGRESHCDSMQQRPHVVRPDGKSNQVADLHIVKATIDDLQSRGFSQGKIGVMGTAGTLKTAMYQEELESRGLTWIVPTEEEMAEYCTPAIALVKANRIAAAYEPAVECIRRLKERGATALVLGCTELPLAVRTSVAPTGVSDGEFDRWLGRRGYSLVL